MNKGPKKHIKFISVIVAKAFIFQLFFPTIVWANGPGQGETKSYTPSGTNNMVNLFTGDLNYSIPLIDVEGYPISLSYNGNVGMNSDASWVGLGWECSPGFINREMRGLPDDFKNDGITQSINLKAEDETKVGQGTIKRSTYSIPFIGATWSKSKEKGTASVNSQYNGVGYEYYRTETHTKGDYFSDNGKSEALRYNSFNGYTYGETSFNKDKDFGFLPGMMGSETTSRTKFYNSRAGLTHVINSAGTGSEWSMGGFGVIADIALTALSLGAFGAVKSTAGTATKLGKISTMASLAFMAVQFPKSSSSNGSSIITTGTPTYTPALSIETFRNTASIESRVTNGFLFWSGGNVYNTTNTEFNTINAQKTTPANGFLNSSSFLYNSQVSTKTLYDMNRENDGVYYETMPNLPVTNATYDVYHVRGDGMVADYRAYRNDVGSYHAPTIEKTGKSFKFGFGYDSNIASYTKTKTVSQSKTKSGVNQWNHTSNNAPENLQFTDGISSVPDYEPYYFKDMGEKVVYNDDFYDSFGGDKPAKVKFLREPYVDPSIINIFKYDYNSFFGVGTEAKLSVKNTNGTYSDAIIPDGRNTASLKDQREYRNSLFVERKAGDLTDYFFQPTITDYELYDEISNPSGTKTVDATISRSSYPANHTGEIVVQNDQGGKYIYSIPTYNNVKNQVSFNVSGRTVDVDDESVTYVTSAPADNSMSNNRGYNNYYNNIETPEYATGYLLTAIVNDDYVDVTGNGISEDDYGTYTKFNYSKIYDDYKWRIPYGASVNEANFSELHHAYTDDDKASYTYGDKEIWNLHSIETKNFIAEFYLSDRNDMVEVAGENGAIGSNKLKKLDKIKLYAKEDRLKNGANAVPIKTVHFEYDYSLCTGIPDNATGGKLTLKKVYFTYGDSEKGEESVYEFKYADFDNDGTQDVNYSFSKSSTDRWGIYKPNSLSLINSEFPFVEQDDRTQADKYAAAWRLSEITSPEGAVTQIFYEADDYAYVQNKRAMQMFKIQSTDSEVDDNFDPQVSTGNKLYDSYSTSNNFIYFKLQDNITSGSESDAEDFLAENYFKDLEHLYFKSFVKLGDGKEQYVEGYANILDFGVVGGTTAPYEYGWIELDPNFYNGSNGDFYSGSITNPIAKAGWQALRMDVPRAYRDLTTQIYDLIALSWIQSGHINPDRLYKARSFADEIDLDKSWIRLVNPNKKKIGGGARVSKITVSDAWGDMGGSSDETYGTIYEYTTDINGETISSGVASYEPYVGNEENPWRQPVFYKKHNRQFPTDYLYQETPFGESHFPSATVGYSSVTVKNIERDDVTKNATGYAVNKFYTSKDFPTIVDQTGKSVSKFASTPTKSQLILGIPTINHSFASQGFVIKKNDMHGKEKGSEVYNEGGSLISKSTIYYKSDLLGGDSYELNNSATVINKDGTKSEVTIGKDIDMYNSYRESYDEDAFTSKTKGRNYSIFSLGGLLGKIKSQSRSKSSKRLYTTVFTKVISQYGLIDRIETEDLGTKNIVTNIAYDGETGNLLLNSVKNEYGDEVYKFQYPAHWYYENLEQAYKNIGISLFGLTSPASPNNGVVSLSSTEIEYFVAGDKLSVDDGTTVYNAWVLEVDKINNKITCIKEDGSLLPQGTLDISIIESGRSNMQNFPIGTVTCLTNPIAGTNLSFSDVISSSAVELSDNWTTSCQPPSIDNGTYPNAYESYSLANAGNIINPFVKGVRGKWRAHLSYSYNNTRTPILTATTSDIRTDGTYTAFKPFWGFSASGELVPIYHDDYVGGDNTLEKWRENTEMTRYGKDGNLLETRDIIDRHATTLYGYSPTYKNIPIAITSNSQQNQIAFDGFEDYEYLDDASIPNLDIPGHFNFSKNSDSLISTDEAHTGLKSLKISEEESHHMGKAIRPIDCSSEGEFASTVNYTLQHCDCEKQFSPNEGDYIVSVWVKQDAGTPGTTITDAQLKVDQLTYSGHTSVSLTTLTPSGPVIDGWQRIEGKVSILNTADYIVIVLKNNGSGGANDIYFDDFRFHPYNSAMKTMVYRPDNVRLMAELDNQNYATFFEYDEEGTLVRIKKETEKGIVTIKETRSSVIKKP